MEESQDFYGDYVPSIMGYSGLPPNVFNLISKATRESSKPAMEMFKSLPISTNELIKYLEETNNNVGISVHTEKTGDTRMHFTKSVYHFQSCYRCRDMFRADIDEYLEIFDRFDFVVHREMTTLHPRIAYPKEVTSINGEPIEFFVDPVTAYNIYSRRESIVRAIGNAPKSAAIDYFDRFISDPRHTDIHRFLYLKMCYRIMELDLPIGDDLDDYTIEDLEYNATGYMFEMESKIMEHLESL